MPDSETQRGPQVPETALTRSSPELPLSRWSENLLLVALAGIFLWRGFIPGWRSINTDFPNYYLGARLYRQGYPVEHFYDWIWFQRQKDHAGIQQSFATFVGLTPFSLLPILPFSWLPPLQAKHCWLIVNLILLALTVSLLAQMTRLRVRRLALFVFLMMIPLRNNFLFGQEHVLVLFLLTAAAWLYFRNWPASSGAALASAAALKAYPFLFLFFFMRKKQWRALAGLMAAATVLAIIGLRLYGVEAIRSYIVRDFARSISGDATDPYNVILNSFTAFFHRLLIAEPELNPHPLVHLPTAYALAQAMCQALLFIPFLWLIDSARSEPAREKLEWGSYVALLLAMSTLPASYHFCALVLTGVLVADYLLASGHARQAGMLLILYGFVGMPLQRLAPVSPAGWRSLLGFPRLYAMAALWIFLVSTFAHSAPQSLRARLKSRETAIFASLLLLMTALGLVTNLRHLRGRFDNYNSRLVAIPGSIMAIEPSPESRGLLYTTIVLNPGRYVTARYLGGVLSLLNFGTDSFHPSFAPGTSEGWVELASTVSRAVHLPSNGARPPAQSSLEVSDAEAPVVSSDGKWLAFIRETRGRGSLWVKQLEPKDAGAPTPSAEKELAGPAYDVGDVAFFPDGRIAFAALPAGRWKLFVADPVSARVSDLKTSRRQERYPAVSPDGQWVAFSQEEHGAWQLWVMKLATREEGRLTSVDCNAVTPAWLSDSKTLIYATDCGRGLGLTALCKIQAVP